MADAPPRPSSPGDMARVGTTFTDPSNVTIGHGQRYYAAPPVEEKRRSFWRKSINPAEIGVAVSPEVAQQQEHDSPDSYTSQRTASQLLPAMPSYALWPAPLRTSRQMSVVQEATRPESTATEFEEDLGRVASFHQAVTVPYQGQGPTSYPEMTQRMVPSRNDKRLSTDPRAQMYRLERAQVAASKGQIPLTPVYDNGNPTPVDHNKGAFDGVIPGSSDAVISVIPAPHRSSQFGSSSTIIPNYQQNAIRQQPRQNIPKAPILSQTPQYPRQPAYRQQNAAPPSYASQPPTSYPSNRTRQHSRDSAASDITTFETDEDTTPESELDNRLKPPPILSPVIESPARLPAVFIDNEKETSPIKDLQYPRVPRPAAISRQAEKPSRPRAGMDVDTRGPPPKMNLPPTRDQLIRDGRSFLQSQSTSSANASRGSSPSLLEKRGRAARLTLNEVSINKPLAAQKWKVIQPEQEQLRQHPRTEQQQPRTPQQHPRTPQMPLQEQKSPRTPQQQPRTPQRKPKLALDTNGSDVENQRYGDKDTVGLTPTRRGRDLFLTVH